MSTHVIFLTLQLFFFVTKWVYLCFEQHLRILEAVPPFLLPRSTNEDSDYSVSSALITWHLSREYVRCTCCANTATFHSFLSLEIFLLSSKSITDTETNYSMWEISIVKQTALVYVCVMSNWFTIKKLCIFNRWPE